MKKKCWMLTMVAVLTLSVAAMFTGCSNKNDATTTEKTTEGGSSTTATTMIWVTTWKMRLTMWQTEQKIWRTM